MKNKAKLKGQSTKDRLKAAEERRIFRLFLSANHWPHGSIYSMKEPRPDILYKAPHQVPMAFELAELADEGFSRHITRSADTYIDIQNPLPHVIKRKWQKQYDSAHAIHLLLYVGSRVALWDDCAENEARLICNSFTADGSFSHVWYWGSGTPIQVWSKEKWRPTCEARAATDAPD